MNTLMFVNGLDKIVIACIVPDPAQYGKFMCNYAMGGKLQQYAYHQKCGFNTFAEAVNWYLTRFPSGELMDQINFLSMQQQLLNLVPPNPNANIFNPLHMTERPRPTPARRTKDGQIVSDFE